MANVKIETIQATVVDIHPFQTRQGEGVDFNVEAKGDTCTVYLQVVLYDAKARTAMSQIRKDDTVDVSGCLKCKTYLKKDGTAGYSLIVENPDRFEIHAETEPQEPQAGPASQQIVAAETDRQDREACMAQQEPQADTASQAKAYGTTIPDELPF